MVRLNPFGTGLCLPTRENCTNGSCRRSLNPFGTGLCLPTWVNPLHVVSVSQSLWNRAVSSDSGWVNPLHIVSGLNPFGTGQCLPTPKDYRYRYSWKVSIPLEQGSVFRHYIRNEDNNRRLSQSLWNRAVSSDCSGILKPCGTRLTRATSQLFPRLRELGLDLIKCCTKFNILFTYQAVENGRDFTRVFRFY